MLSVVHIDTSRSWRGGQLQVFLLHRELLRLGIESRLLARAGGPLQARCEEVGLPVEAVPLMRPWHPPAIFAVCRLTRRATIVHAHDSHAATLAAIARTLNPRIAVVCHRRVAFGPRARLAERWKYRHIDRWIAVSADIAGKLRRAGAIDLRVVPSAVDVDDLREQATERSDAELRSELGIGASAPVIGLVGALAAQKGHEALVAAAPRILEAAPEAVFLCVGEGRLSRRLQRRLRRNGLGSAFRFTGFRRDVAALMGLCTIIIAPSRPLLTRPPIISRHVLSCVIVQGPVVPLKVATPPAASKTTPDIVPASRLILPKYMFPVPQNTFPERSIQRSIQKITPTNSTPNERAPSSFAPKRDPEWLSNVIANVSITEGVASDTSTFQVSDVGSWVARSMLT